MLPSPSARSESPNTAIELEALGWYHVSRATLPGGNEIRTLYVGTLDGTLAGQVVLGTLEAAAQEGRADAYAWIDPQAAGIFGDSVLVWGRQGGAAAIEAVRVETGAAEALITDAEGTVHVATADPRLGRVFFVTVDESTQLPNGLWLDDLHDRAGPARMDYLFSDQAVSRQAGYRLVANQDGSVLAVQAGHDGAVTLIQVDSGISREIRPGGPMLGFMDDALVAYGPSSDVELPVVLAYSLTSGNSQVLANDADAARVVDGTEGPLLAVMHIDPLETRRFQIIAIDPATGESRRAYDHDPRELGPMLASLDRTFLGAEVPPDWVLLTDSFLPFIEEPGLEWKDPPLSTYPMLLNLRTTEALRLGPFGPSGSPTRSRASAK